mgnify:FL=1|jgi:hypothetical protein|tara:strand:- start:737 stop:928 length:192 start_codon:yes stop_codon:yes gene_type:complete
MEMKGHIISGVKVINIVEENASSIEKMANKMITDLHIKKIKILDLQITGDNLILVLGEKAVSS